MRSVIAVTAGIAMSLVVDEHYRVITVSFPPGAYIHICTAGKSYSQLSVIH